MTAREVPSIDEHLLESLTQQFPNFTITRGELPELEPGLVGQIGFLTRDGRGSLGIVAEQKTLNLLEPEIGGRILDVADWIGELANLTLGRIKMRIRGPMDGIVSSTPVVLRHTKVCVEAVGELRTFRLERNGVILGVWIDLTSIDLSRELSDSSEDTIREGETVLFF